MKREAGGQGEFLLCPQGKVASPRSVGIICAYWSPFAPGTHATPLQVRPRSLYLSERRKRPISLSHTSFALEFPSPEWRSCCTFDNTQKP